MPLSPQTQYRVSIAGSQPEQQSHDHIQQLVDADTRDLSLMSLDQSSGWQKPADFGITKKIPNTPATPTPPSAPSTPSAPTTDTQTDADAGLVERVLSKSSRIADRMLSGFSDTLARKLAKMAGQPDPITGEEQPKPHPAPEIESKNPSENSTNSN